MRFLLRCIVVLAVTTSLLMPAANAARHHKSHAAIRAAVLHRAALRRAALRRAALRRAAWLRHHRRHKHHVAANYVPAPVHHRAGWHHRGWPLDAKAKAHRHPSHPASKPATLGKAPVPRAWNALKKRTHKGAPNVDRPDDRRSPADTDRSDRAKKRDKKDAAAERASRRSK